MSSSPTQIGLQFSRPVDHSNIYFFKIIVPSILEEDQLELPCELVRREGHKLSDIVTLEVRNGDIWQVKLRKAHDKIWFGEGWKDFANYYSLSTCHFLIFKYNGCSRFGVVICDDFNTVEINYEKNDNKRKRGITESSARSPNAIQRDNPSFVVTLKPSCVNTLTVPLGFVKKHLGTNTEDITLCVDNDASDKGVWKVKCRVYYDGVAKLLRWTKFCKDNNLKVRDKCVFELTSKTSVTFKVSIIRADEAVTLGEASNKTIPKKREKRITKKKNKTVMDTTKMEAYGYEQEHCIEISSDDSQGSKSDGSD